MLSILCFSCFKDSKDSYKMLYKSDLDMNYPHRWIYSSSTYFNLYSINLGRSQVPPQIYRQYLFLNSFLATSYAFSRILHLVTLCLWYSFVCVWICIFILLDNENRTVIIYATRAIWYINWREGLNIAKLIKGIQC